MPKKKKYTNLRWLWLSGFLIVIDQITKSWVSQVLLLYQAVPISKYISLTLAHNQGAAFSFLEGAGGWQRWFFISVAVIVSIVIFVWLFRLPKPKPWLACALSLVMGGALGNLLDRIVFGYVVDFVHFHVNNWYWPAFNVADSSICIGTFILILALRCFRSAA